MRLKTLLFCLALPASAVWAQGPDIAAELKGQWTQVRGLLLASAEKVAASDYGFKPADSVRSYGQLMGHVADGWYLFCAATRTDKPTESGVEKAKTTKDDIIASLKAAAAYCDGAHDGLTNEKLMEKVKFFGGERSRLNVLYFNYGHSMEHYGNAVTYMRMRGLVPPSSEPRPSKK